MPSFIIVGYVWQILGRDLFDHIPTPHLWAAPKCPSLNRVKSCKRVMQFSFSKVAAHNLTKKGLHQRFFPVKFVKLVRTVFTIATFGKWFCMFQDIKRFYRCFYVILLSLFWLQCDWSDIWFHNLRVARKRRSGYRK